MKHLIYPLLILISCQCTSPPSPQKHIFYLHGRILESQGINAVSEQFGPYKYQEIIDSLSSMSPFIYAEVRPKDVDFYDFSERVSFQIDSLVDVGIAPTDIAVIGASKGAVMSMYVSHINQHPIHYILLGANNDYIEQENDWHLKGRILGFYEQSDALAGKNYQHWIKNSPEAISFEEIQLQTGLGHGFLYRPLPEWLAPTREWIMN